MPDMESHWLAERLAYLGRSLLRDTVWRQKVQMSFLALSPTPKPRAAVSLRVPHCLPASAERPSVNFLGQVTFLGLERNCSGEFRCGSSRGATRLVAGGDLLSIKLGARFGLLEQRMWLARALRKYSLA